MNSEPRIPADKHLCVVTAVGRAGVISLQYSSETCWCHLTALLQWDVLVPSHCSTAVGRSGAVSLQWDVLVPSHCSTAVRRAGAVSLQYCSGTCWCRLTAALQWDVLVPSHCITAVGRSGAVSLHDCSGTFWCRLLASVQLIRRCYDYTLLLP